MRRTASLRVFGLVVSGCCLGLAANAVGGEEKSDGECGVSAEFTAQGGLIVHLGCGDGRLTTALHRGQAYRVHGLDADEEDVRQARKFIRSSGLYGPVSVEQWGRPHLPYGDNLVNLLVVTRGEWQVAR